MCSEPTAMPAWQVCRVSERRELVPGTVLLWLEAPALADLAHPGQFAQVAVPGSGADPFLRRPISLGLIDRERGRVGLIIREAGRGTRAIAACGAGAALDLIGPLGRGFPSPAGGRSLLVGGGIGAAPLFGLATGIAKGLGPHQAQTRMLMLLGARHAGELWARDLASELGLPALIATDDGSAGHPGLVTEILAAELASGHIGTVYACGPTPMLSTVGRLAREAGVRGYLSLEQRMACGVGACLGCAWPRSESAGGGYAHVCRDGPVFEATEVII